ncbi:MAG TPA: phage baseplate assembly protein V [Methanocella sp.]|uniref:phage baseplate assembly protein V n=1 Tax=Methanocella sp. TaxID=2052833 RepID=UPI002C8303F7|nr:phage baseplate assembly protein V [Methanocella sp.]HTY90425.1 phage baseplate assembly protein V [Methanocella sp.]
MYYNQAERLDSPVMAIKKIAEDEVRKQRTLELAQVTSIYPHSSGSDNDNYACDVKLKNGDNELRKVPVVTPHAGFAHVPNIGDLVLIGYIGGSVNSPVILGSLYNDDQRPPVNDAGDIIYESPDGTDSNRKRLYLKFPNDITMTLTDDGLKLEMGQTTVSIQHDGDVEVQSNANVTITAQKDMKLSAQNITLESQASLGLKAGSDLKIESGGNANVQASGMMALKGSMVNIN